MCRLLTRMLVWGAILFASTSVVLSSMAVQLKPADNYYLDSVRRQLLQIAHLIEANALYAQFLRIHIEPEQMALALIESAIQGQALTADQSKFILETVRPALQVDMLRRAVVYQALPNGVDVADIYSERRGLIEVLRQILPSNYQPVARRYAELMDKIAYCYQHTPQDAVKLNTGWLAELDAIRAQERFVFGNPVTPPLGRLSQISKIRSQANKPICGSTSLAMALEVALNRNVEPETIADVIGWDGTTGPMMWAYAYDYAGLRQARLQVLSMTDLRELISRNVPVVVFQQYSAEKRFGHARLIVGYDDNQQKIEYVESDEGALRSMSYTECEKLWAPLQFTALVLEK